MNAENTFRWLCELSTAFTFTCFLILFQSTEGGGYYGAYIGSAMIALCSWFANCESDKSNADKGIQYNKNQLSSRIYIFISNLRYWMEKIAAGILSALMLFYLITMSFETDILGMMAYYEVKIIILEIMIVSYFLFISSLTLVFVSKRALGNNSMKRMLQ